jgi:hypothetical protein
MVRVTKRQNDAVTKCFCHRTVCHKTLTVLNGTFIKWHIYVELRYSTVQTYGTLQTRTWKLSYFTLWNITILTNPWISRVFALT